MRVDSPSRRRRLGRLVPLGSVLLAAVATQGGARADAPKAGEAVAKTPPANPDHWTAATPDEMVDNAIARARRGKDDTLAALVIAAGLDDRASFGRVRAGLDAIAASDSPYADDARWLSLRHAPTPPSSSWPGTTKIAYDAPADASGLVKAFAILGPFQDTGGDGVRRKEGPEAPGQRWTDERARYAWGVYDVAWRRVHPDHATPRGVPLDLYISPRNESCTILASKVSFPAGAKPTVVHVAASGAVRLIWDAADVAVSEDVHPRLVLDRMAARIESPAGDHLVAVKVCSGSVGDEGRVRLRFTDEKDHPITLASSSDLRGLPLAAAPDAPADTSAEAPSDKPAKVLVGSKGKPAPVVTPPSKGAKPSKVAPVPKDTRDASPSKKEPPSKPQAKGAPNKGASAKADPGEAQAKATKPRPSEAPSAAPIVPPAGITVRKTTLERALDVGAEGTADQALTASILRTQAGAEDNRSPRAPGLLDRVTRAKDVSADVLALAGWVSTFGANRSGWLNLAHARAAKEKDAATLAFAQRRLTLSHLNSHFADWASSMLNEEPLKSAKDADARLIRAVIKKQLSFAGASRASFEDMLKLEAEQKDQTPLAVLGEIYDSARSDKDVAMRLAKRLAEVKPESRGLRFAEQARFVDGATFERAVADNLSRFTTAEEVIRAARELLDLGRYAWAREVAYYATQIAPNRSSGFTVLASARQAIASAEKRAGKETHEDELALQALGRAHDLEPGDNGLKAEIAFRTTSASSEGHQVMADEQYIPKPEVFLARGKAEPAKKGEIVDRQLSWVRVVTYHPDKRVSQLMHYAREIVIEPRTDNDLFENTPAEGDESELLLARVHRKDGTIAMPEEQSSGGRQPFIHWPELKAGDVVEVAIRSWTANPVGRRGDSPFYFIDYVGSIDTHPILYNEVVVDSPKASPLAIDVLNGKAQNVISSEKDGRIVTRYQWDHPPIIPDEPLAPKQTEILPTVVGSTFAGWGEFREWYRAAVKGFTEPDEQVRRVALEKTKGKKTRDEKLKALFEFVADDIRYVNYVSGEWWLPNRPQELLNRCQGDCDDKAMLLITLLKSVGIEATEVLVQTRYTGEPSLLRSTKVAIPRFDHGIAYLPGKGKEPGIWLDATSPESRLGPLPSMDARAVAMFVDDGDAKIIDTPSSSPDEHGVDASWTFKLDATGAADLTADEKHSGDSAFQLRSALKEADARVQWVEQYLANGWFSTVQVTGDVDFKSDLPKGLAFLKYKAHSDQFARKEGDELAVPIGESATLTSQLAPLVKRTLPVVLPTGLAPGHQTREITIVAPDGYTFSELPPNGDENVAEFGKGHVEFKRASGKNAVVVKRSVTFEMSTIPVDKYDRWREWLQRVDGLMHRMVRLVPDAKAKGKKP